MPAMVLVLRRRDAMAHAPPWACKPPRPSGQRCGQTKGHALITRGTPKTHLMSSKDDRIPDVSAGQRP